jgi:threonine synthase
MLYLPRAATRPQTLLRHPARRPGARWRPVPARALPAGRRRHADALRKAYHEQGYAELAFEILSLYIDDIPAADLKAPVRQDLHRRSVWHGEIVPLRHLEDGLWLEALSNGPTLAFKDMAMQLLGNLFEYELASAAANSSTSWAPPAATPAARPNTPCAARRACASS